MNYSLRDMILAKGTRRESITLPPLDVPPGLWRDLYAILRQVPDAWGKACRDLILPAVYAGASPTLRIPDAAPVAISDGPAEAEAALTRAEQDLQRLVLELTPALADWTVRVEEWHRLRWLGVVKTASGVDLGTMIGPREVAQPMAAVLQQLTGLIRNIDEDMRSRITQTVWRGFTQRTPRSQMVREMRATVDIGKRRAELIARDQTTKLAGVLDQERQREAGIADYIWRHSGKVHYRENHKARDGKRFSWNKPPSDGHPGYAINCGCKAQAFIPLMDEGA